MFKPTHTTRVSTRVCICAHTCVARVPFLLSAMSLHHSFRSRFILVSLLPSTSVHFFSDGESPDYDYSQYIYIVAKSFCICSVPQLRRPPSAAESRSSSAPSGLAPPDHTDQGPFPADHVVTWSWSLPAEHSGPGSDHRRREVARTGQPGGVIRECQPQG